MYYEISFGQRLVIDSRVERQASESSLSRSSLVSCGSAFIRVVSSGMSYGRKGTSLLPVALAIIERHWTRVIVSGLFAF